MVAAIALRPGSSLLEREEGSVVSDDIVEGQLVEQDQGESNHGQIRTYVHVCMYTV